MCRWRRRGGTSAIAWSGNVLFQPLQNGGGDRAAREADHRMRIPGHLDHPFRSKVSTHSDAMMTTFPDSSEWWTTSRNHGHDPGIVDTIPESPGVSKRRWATAGKVLLPYWRKPNASREVVYAQDQRNS